MNLSVVFFYSNQDFTLSYLLSIQYVYERVFFVFALKLLASLAGCKHKTFFRFSQMFFKTFFIFKISFTFQNSKNLFAVAGAKVVSLLSYASAF